MSYQLLTMKNKCLYCYESITGGHDFHEKCALDFFGSTTAPKISYSLSDMDALAKKVIERRVAVPGVQPKLSMSLVREKKKAGNGRLTVVDALGGQYILKPPSDRFPQMPQNEHLTMRIAEEFGIPTVPSSLIHLASGEISYITRRIDRTEDDEKMHMIDMFQITEAFDKYKSSLEKVGKAIGKYSDNTLLDKVFYFEIILFSFLTGNNDMHLKNFSMIESALGWTLTPAYDLLNVAIVLPQDKEELALTLAGKKRNLKKVHFVKLAEGLGLNKKQIDSALNRMVANRSKALAWIEKSFLSKNMKKAYIEVLERKYHQMELSE